MHDLIIATLKEGRVDRGKGLHAIGGQTGSKGHGMLLGDPDIVGAVRETLTKEVKACTGGHGGGDGDDAIIALSLLDQLGRKDLGVAGRRSRGLGLLAGDDIELDHPMVLVGGIFGWGIALALLRHNMN